MKILTPPLGGGRVNFHTLEDNVQYHVRENESVRNSQGYYRVKGRKQNIALKYD